MRNGRKLGVSAIVIILPVVGMGLLGLLSRARGADLLPVGAVAPQVTGTDAAGHTVKLSDEKGKFAVVYFYPKDETTGCTKEACAFRDSFDKFVQAGVTIFAVSRQDDASHKGFRDHYKLQFPMVADTSGQVQKAYGVSSILPGTGLSSRVTFLVGPDGKIAHVWPKVNPVVNAHEVLDTVAQLQKRSP